MTDEQITTALTAKAVTLRIHGGSLEAQYLEAFFPVPVLPAFIIINNGQLVLDLRAGEGAGEGKAQFKTAVLRTLTSTSPLPQRTILSPTVDSDPSMTQHISDQAIPRASTFATGPFPGHSPPDRPATSSSTAGNTADDTNMPPSYNQNADPAATAPSDAIQSNAPSASPGGQPSQTVQNLLADRRRRLEIDKKEKDAAEKAERKAKAEARKESMVVAPDSAKAKQATYAAQQRKRQHEAKLERERILRQIEHDKAERKEKEERRKANAKAEAEGTDGAGGLVDQQLASEVDFPKSTRTRECAVQVRLFDGSTVRGRFPSDGSLRGNVRPFIDREKSDDIPYTFKQVLTPMPNRTLSISEEEETLQSLGFIPSATLVIVPVQGYTAAYSGGQGIVSKGASAGYNIVSAGAGIVTGAFGTFLGLGRGTATGEVPDADAHGSAVQGNAGVDAAETGSGINIRTLQDQRDDQNDHQLYNGNQVMYLVMIT